MEAVFDGQGMFGFRQPGRGDETVRLLTILVFSLIVLTTFVLAVAWEFRLADEFLRETTLTRPVALSDRWQQVLGSTAFVLLALVFPFWISYRAAGEQRRLISRLRQAAHVFESTTDGVMITDANGRIEAVNQAFTDITGFKAGEVLGKNPRLLNSERQDDRFYEDLWEELIRDGRWQGEIWNRRKSGELFPVWESISAIRDDKGRVTHYVAILSDISALKRADERLTHLAHFDPLTDLPNRVLFQDRLGHALDHARRRGGRVGLLFIDLDGFKAVNDALGHATGDRLLREVAQRLRSCVRQCDTVARLSGDEFTVILEGLLVREHVMPIVQNIVEGLAVGYGIDGQEIRVTASVGVSFYPDDGREVNTLMQKADAAMYQAKEAGGNDFQPRTLPASIVPSGHASQQAVPMRHAMQERAQVGERL